MYVALCEVFLERIPKLGKPLSDAVGMMVPDPDAGGKDNNINPASLVVSGVVRIRVL